MAEMEVRSVVVDVMGKRNNSEFNHCRRIMIHSYFKLCVFKYYQHDITKLKLLGSSTPPPPPPYPPPPPPPDIKISFTVFLTLRGCISGKILFVIWYLIGYLTVSTVSI